VTHGDYYQENVYVTVIKKMSKLKFTRSHAIAKMTARCAQYMRALKIVCRRKISRRLRKNLHITILSLFGGEIIFEVFQWSNQCDHDT